MTKRFADDCVRTTLQQVSSLAVSESVTHNARGNAALSPYKKKMGNRTETKLIRAFECLRKMISSNVLTPEADYNILVLS